MFGYKLLQEDGTSLNGKFKYLVPKRGWSKWQEVPGNGSYVAVEGGLTVGGLGPLLVEVEGRDKLIDHGRIKTFRFVRLRRLPKDDLVKVAMESPHDEFRSEFARLLNDQKVFELLALNDPDVAVRSDSLGHVKNKEVLKRVVDAIALQVAAHICKPERKTLLNLYIECPNEEVDCFLEALHSSKWLRIYDATGFCEHHSIDEVARSFEE